MSDRIPFYVNDGSVIVDLSVNICKTNIDVLESDGFKVVLSRFMKSITPSSNRALFRLLSVFDSSDEMIGLYKKLLVFSFDDLVGTDEGFVQYKEYRRDFVLFTEQLYDYWRNFERYGIIKR